MVLTIDTMAKRYKMLPTEVLSKATTFDLYIMDAAVAYHNYQTNKAMGDGTPDLTEQEMFDILAKTKQ